MHFWPFPSQSSQRPPGRLKLNRARLITANLGLGQPREKLANRFEHAGVSRRVRRRRVSQRLLVDDDHLVDQFQSANFGVRTGRFRCAIQPLGDRPRKRVFDQRTLARAGHAGDARERAQRQTQIDVVQVVLPGTQQLDPAAARRIVFGLRLPSAACWGSGFLSCPTDIAR